MIWNIVNAALCGAVAIIGFINGDPALGFIAVSGVGGWLKAASLEAE